MENTLASQNHSRAEGGLALSMHKTWVVALFFLLAATTQAHAWNSFGHMEIAAVTWERLTPAAKREATRLIKLNPDYPNWVANVPDAEKDKIAFELAATWPDIIKHEQGYHDDGEKPKGEESGQNLGYSDKLQHRYWHYIDMPFSLDNTALVEPAAPNAKTQITKFKETLSSTAAADDVKSYDLVWLLHLVGDVHQPLHTTSRFTKGAPKGDAGGNLVSLCKPPKEGCREELHAFCDDVLGTRNHDPYAAARAAAKLPEADAKLAAVADEDNWIEESFEAAKVDVYVAPIGDGEGPYQLDAEYKAHAKDVARNRAGLAGARLAQFLNNVFK